jgi:hypothetical protein
MYIKDSSRIILVLVAPLREWFTVSVNKSFRPFSFLLVEIRCNKRKDWKMNFNQILYCYVLRGHTIIKTRYNEHNGARNILVIIC